MEIKYYNPYLHRGSKLGLHLKYNSERSFIVTPGQCHLSLNDEDVIIYLNEERKIDIIYSIPWNYHYVYIDIDLNINYDSLHPKFDLNRLGFYHRNYNNLRCIGLFFIMDGSLPEFKYLQYPNHSYDQKQIYQFSRKYQNNTESDKEFKNLLLDKIKITEPVNHYIFPLYNQSSYFKLRCPNFGTDIENCNLYPEVLINIISNSNENCELYTLPLQNDVDSYKNKFLPEKKLLNIKSTPQNSYNPNKFYDHVTIPYIKNVNIYTNLLGFSYFRCNTINTNSIYLSTIGCVLPKFIADDDGYVSKTIIDKFNGFKITKIDYNNIKISKGELYFPFKEIWYNKLTNDIILDLRNYNLKFDKEYYIYVTPNYNSIELEITNFTISENIPINYKNIYISEKSVNSICIGKILTGYYNILDKCINIVDLYKYYDIDNKNYIEIIVDDSYKYNKEYILNLILKNKKYLEILGTLPLDINKNIDYKLLYSDYYNFNWSKIENTNIYKTDFNIDIPKTKINLKELKQNLPVYFKIDDGQFSLYIDDYYMDDNMKIINTLYLDISCKDCFNNLEILCDLRINEYSIEYNNNFIPCIIYNLLDKRYNPFDLHELYLLKEYILSKNINIAIIETNNVINCELIDFNININRNIVKIKFKLIDLTNINININNKRLFYLYEDNNKLELTKFNLKNNIYTLTFNSIILDGESHNLKIFSIGDDRFIFNINYETWLEPKLACDIEKIKN